jgi:putative DNA primase/helicase
MSTPHVDETTRVRAALAVIPADDYSTWVDIAFALRHGFGDAGFEIWDEWSRTAGNYNERSARTTWRSAKESGGKTLASLFWLARQHGFDVSRIPRPDRTATALAPGPDVPERRAREEARQQARHAAVAREAQSMWQWARPVGPEHPYLVRKHLGSTPTPTLRELEAPELHSLLGYAPVSGDQPLLGRVLLVPFWIGEAISTLELIDEHGRKSSLAGGVKRGGYWIAGPAPTDIKPGTPILIGEGMATVLSAYRATHWMALASLSGATLPQVTAILRERYPDTELVVLGDIGPGEAGARQAAEASRARLAFPVFTGGARIDDKVPTDFNDMAAISGLACVGLHLREIMFRDVGSSTVRLAPTVGIATGVTLNEPKEQIMGNVKEKLISEAKGTSRHRGSKHNAPGPDATRDAAPDSSAPQPAAATLVDDSGATPSRQIAPVRPPVGEPLFAVADVPDEVRALAGHRFGTPLRMATPRGNGGPYRGEVFNTAEYLIQEVATRSVVFHPKAQMEFVSDRLRWMDENARLNGFELQVGYDGDRPRVFPWDRSRDLLERTVASLKKSARELDLGPDLEGTLDQLQARSWARIRDARTAALEQSKERAASQDPHGPEC